MILLAGSQPERRMNARCRRQEIFPYVAASNLYYPLRARRGPINVFPQGGFECVRFSLQASLPLVSPSQPRRRRCQRRLVALRLAKPGRLRRWRQTSGTLARTVVIGAGATAIRVTIGATVAGTARLTKAGEVGRRGGRPRPLGSFLSSAGLPAASTRVSSGRRAFLFLSGPQSRTIPLPSRPSYHSRRYDGAVRRPRRVA
jgi:hypothetical protein